MRHQTFLLPKSSPTDSVYSVWSRTRRRGGGRGRSRRRRGNPASPRLGRIRVAGSYRTARRLFRALEYDDWSTHHPHPRVRGAERERGRRRGGGGAFTSSLFGAFLSRAQCARVRVRVCWSGRQTDGERTRGVYSEVALFRLSLFGSRCEWMNVVSGPSWWMNAVVLASCLLSASSLRPLLAAFREIISGNGYGSRYLHLEGSRCSRMADSR
jgi:hypothetical protein